MKEYRKRIELGPCRLEKADLLKLAKLVKETLTISGRKEDFEISTLLPNINIKENSIEDFLKHEELPDKFDDLSIEAIGRDARADVDKSITLEFASYGNTVYVRGTDETWVLGKSEQIVDYLRGKRPWFGLLINVFPFIGGFLVALAITTLSYFIGARELLYSVSTAFLLVTVIFAMAFNLSHKFLPYTQIIVTPRESLLNKENIILIISILTLIITIIGFIK
jgi:hypothetical protein